MLVPSSSAGKGSLDEVRVTWKSSPKKPWDSSGFAVDLACGRFYAVLFETTMSPRVVLYAYLGRYRLCGFVKSPSHRFFPLLVCANQVPGLLKSFISSASQAYPISHYGALEMTSG